MVKRKAPRSQDFTPKGEDRHAYLLSDIPGPLWRKTKRMAKRRGVSVRAMILHYLETALPER